MKITPWLILPGILGAAPITLAQVRFAAETYESDPEKYLGQRVTILVDSVSVPAVNATSEEDDFRLFSVSTKGQRQGGIRLGRLHLRQGSQKRCCRFRQTSQQLDRQGPQKRLWDFS